VWPVTRTRMVLPFSRWVSLFHRIGPASRSAIDAPGSSLILCHMGRRAAETGGRMLTTESRQLGGAAACRLASNSGYIG
jgi:hypothetical protein